MRRERVHARIGKRRQRAVGGPVELHEDEVPDLEEPPLLREALELWQRERRRGIARTPLEIHVDLGVVAARSGVGHLPEVVLVAKTVDPRVGKARDLAPECARLGVGLVHAHGQAVGMEPEVLARRQELPGERDRVALEVIAEGEVPQHLEKGVVPPGVPDLLEVVVLAARAHAFLARRRPEVVAPLLSEEDALELHHARVDEQQRRVVGGHQRRRRHLAVPPGDEIIEKQPSDLRGLHGGNIEEQRRYGGDGGRAVGGRDRRSGAPALGP